MRHWLAQTLFLTLFSSSFAAANLVTDLARKAEVMSAKISPGGDYLAVMKDEDDRRVVAVFSFPDMKLINVIAFPGKNEVGNYWWVNDERILTSIAVDYGNREQDTTYGELYAVNADGKKGKYLFGYRGDQLGATDTRVNRVTTERAWGRYINPLWPDPRKVVIQIQDWDGGFKSVTRIAKLDVYTGRVTDEIFPPHPNSFILTNRAGKPLFSYYLNDDQVTIIHRRNEATQEWEPFSKAAYGESQTEPLHVADDGRIYVRKAEDDGPLGLYLLDPKTGEYEKLFQHERVDVGGLYMDFDENVYGTAYSAGKFHQEFFDNEHPNVELIRGLQSIFPNAVTYVTSSTHDFRLSIVRVYEDVRTPEYYLFNRETNSLQLMFDAKPWINDAALPEMHPVSIVARDGLELDGYLTLPRGSKAENLPLVIVPHGGPHGPRDHWGLGWENFIPAAGYAMLQVNYRGSGGYGMAFERAGFGEWGGKMQDDLTDSVKWAIDEGIADPDRVCIFGWSYGGFAAVMSIIREPDLYKCSVAGAGSYDTEIQYRRADYTKYTRWGKKYMDKVLGSSPAERRRASPVEFAEQITTPLLLIHGEDDDRVPVEHAYALQKAMEKAGKPMPRLIELKNEPHGIRNEKNITTWYTETVKFIESHIGPGVGQD